jgi:hypothetical protein
VSASDEEKSALEEAIRRFKASALDLEAGREGLVEQVRNLERDLEHTLLRLKTALDILDAGAAFLASDGTILLANEIFEELGLGRQGGTPDDPLRELVDELRTKGGAGTRLSRETPGGCQSLNVSVLPVEGSQGTFLLVVRPEDDRSR